MPGEVDVSIVTVAFLIEIYQYVINKLLLISELPLAKQWKFPKYLAGNEKKIQLVTACHS